MKKPATTFPEDRAAALAAEQHRKMAASAHAYVRGSTVRFYEWLTGTDRLRFPQGPEVWICGDCHVGNLGPVAGTNGQVAIEIRDLDQTVIGNPAHDLIRLALSLAMAARSSDLPGVTTAHMLECMMHGYEEGLLASGNEEKQGTVLPETVKLTLREATSRSWRHLADERIEGVEPSIPLGKRFWPLTDVERSAVDRLFDRRATRDLVTALRTRDGDARVRVLDAAYWRKGCSSLGRLRLAVLVAIGEGKHERHCLMDIKEAIEPAAPASTTAAMPSDNAERVVTGARSLSPLLGNRMIATSLLGRSVSLRELLPQDLKLEIEHLTTNEAKAVAGYLAFVVGQSHARQMDEAGRQGWIVELQRHRSATLDAPSWLWNCVVELVSVHEAAYLEHCRKYALLLAA